jgi:NhaC family Na+:H+ antiporter
LHDLDGGPNCGHNYFARFTNAVLQRQKGIRRLIALRFLYLGKIFAKMSKNSPKRVSLIVAFSPLLFLIGLLAFNIYFFKDDATGGANQIALLLAAGVAAFIGKRLGYSWSKMQKGVVKSLKSAMSAILILLMIGALSGTWMISGIVPTMIYYGLEILNPTIFLLAACIVSAIVSLATGSSWSTVATVGVALLGVGVALGLSEGMVAGAIISGAYFGDKMSPMSDTTNLAPAMAGTDLFTHIKYMAYTTFPSIGITLIIFLILGLNTDAQGSQEQVETMMTALQESFYISPVLFLVPVAVILLIVKKMSALPALFIGSLLGGVFAIIFQPELVQTIAGETQNYAEAAYITLFQSMSNAVSIDSSNQAVSDLLSTSGMFGMMNTIWLVICAMTFGGVLEVTGILHRITQSIVKGVHSTGSLIAATVGTCLFFNTTASDQYLAIVVPGKMFAETYEERGLAPENLSRTLEDSGTVTSVLIPWNTCGATQSTVLGVATGEYWMYCFFNLISPVMTLTFGYLNIKIRKLKKED